MQRNALYIFVKLILFLIPVFLFSTIYLILDPFMILYKYQNYYTQDKKHVLNRDYISTEIFLSLYPEKQFDSFIFGNSRSLAFFCKDWGNYIESKNIFHFDANGESLFGIWRKFKLLETKQVNIKNALILLDFDTLKETSNTNHILFTKHPKIAGEGELHFHFIFFKAFFGNLFFLKYLDYRFFGFLPQDNLDFIDKRTLIQIPETNDLIFFSEDDDIRQNGEKIYYTKHKENFYDRSPTLIYDPKIISTDSYSMLMEIKQILSKSQANYNIIIPPTYNQHHISKEDLKDLENIFGKNFVHNFSGINKFTENIHNYYEIFHFRPHVAKEILSIIYQQN